MELPLSRLTEIQYSYPPDYKSNVILQDKLLNTIRNVPECQLVYRKPADSFQVVMSVFHAALETYPKTSTVVSQSRTEIIYAKCFDRRYMINTPGQSSNFRNANKKKCIVCHKPGCWSTNRPYKKLIQAFKSSIAIRKFIVSIHADVEQ